MMWGNARGWILSAVMVLATALAMWRLASPGPESTPQGLVPLAYEPVRLPMEASVVMPAGSAPCDAGNLYRQALIQYRADPGPYEDAVHAKPGALPAVDLLLQATDCSRMTLFESDPKQIINYDNDEPSLRTLQKIADAAGAVGLGELLDGKYDDCAKYFRAAFALGRRLFEERVSWREMSAGLDIMSQAARNLTRLADETRQGARGDALRKFQEQTDKYRADLQEKVASPLGNPVEGYASKYAGDIFAVARDTSAERVWRVQAILHLGHYRWNVADDRRADQVWADRELRALETSPDPKNADPVILAAINAARNLTVEQQRLNSATE